jgi:hypothetical protein
MTNPSGTPLRIYPVQAEPRRKVSVDGSPLRCRNRALVWSGYHLIQLLPQQTSGAAFTTTGWGLECVVVPASFGRCAQKCFFTAPATPLHWCAMPSFCNSLTACRDRNRRRYRSRPSPFSRCAVHDRVGLLARPQRLASSSQLPDRGFRREPAWLVSDGFQHRI